MRAGSVIVDLAGATGGNCELTRPGQTVIEHGVTIASPLAITSALPEHASQLYARNVRELIALMLSDDGTLTLDFTDEILAATRVTPATHDAPPLPSDLAPLPTIKATV